MGSDNESGKKAGEVIGEMGRERLALRAKRTAAVLLGISSSFCSVSALASLVGYIPHTIGLSIVLLIASIAGFVASVLEARVS